LRATRGLTGEKAFEFASFGAAHGDAAHVHRIGEGLGEGDAHGGESGRAAVHSLTLLLAEMEALFVFPSERRAGGEPEQRNEADRNGGEICEQPVHAALGGTAPDQIGSGQLQ
tara:strand:- start:854 stop:1192 length:339 start_codon:yes stop_codon:yes gene_type:complete